MPILTRSIAETKTIWTHKVTSKYFECYFTVKKEKIVSAQPQIHWMLGHRYDKVREQCSRQCMEITDLRQRKVKSNA